MEKAVEFGPQLNATCRAAASGALLWASIDQGGGSQAQSGLR